MQEKGWEEKNKIAIGIFIGLSIVIVAGLSWLRCPAVPVILRNTFVYSLFLAVTMTKFNLDKKKQCLNYDNNDNSSFFLISLVIAYCVALLCSLISPLVWPLITFSVVLSLFSNALCGMIAYISILSIPIMLINADNWIFIIYVLTGIVAIVGFDGWERDFKSVKPFLATSVCLVVSQSVAIWIYSDFENILFFVLPSLVNLFINGLSLFIFLKKFTTVQLKNEEDHYMDINDQSYILMEKLKDDSIDDYYRCIHTAHFSDILSKNVNADTSAVRTAAYYYRFGLIYSQLGVTGHDMSEYMLHMMDGHNFPEKARLTIEELCNKKLVSKESALVYIADYFIKSILFLMKAKPDDKPDWDKCVDYVFDRSLDENVFEQCAITVGELKTCMTLLKRDKMYYEFLCRK